MTNAISALLLLVIVGLCAAFGETMDVIGLGPKSQGGLSSMVVLLLLAVYSLGWVQGGADAP